MLCYGMLFFCLLFFSLPLNEFNAVISAHRPRLTGNFQSFDKPRLRVSSIFKFLVLEVINSLSEIPYIDA